LEDGSVGRGLIVEGGLWVKVVIDQMDPYASDPVSCFPVHPMMATREIVIHRHPIPEHLKPYLEIASDKDRLREWCREHAKELEVIARRVRGGDSRDWIEASQRAVAEAFQRAGTQPGYLESLKKRGIIKELERLAPHQWRMIFTDPHIHAMVKKFVRSRRKPPTPREPRREGPEQGGRSEPTGGDASQP
jgi:hypothetical protein